MMWSSKLHLPLRAIPLSRHQSTLLKPLSEVPGPKRIPFLGNFLNFKTADGKMDPAESLSIIKHLWGSHGDLIMIDAPFREPILFIFDPDLAEKIYRAAGSQPIRPGFEALKHVRSQDTLTQAAPGLLTSQQEAWHNFRSKVQQPMMRPKSALRYTHDLDEIADEFMLEKLDKGRDPKTNQVGEAFIEDLYKWALESVTFLALNTRLGCLKPGLPHNSEQMVIIRAVSDIFQTTMYLDNSLMLWKYFPSPKLKKFQRGYEIFKDACSKYIYKAMEDIKNANGVTKGEPTLLEMFQARGCDEQTAVVMALDMMFAGVDTSSHLTAFALYQLAKNPEVQDKLFQELREVIPDKNTKIDEKTMERLPYLKAVFKETLRFHPPAALNARTLTEPTELGGYEIPAGALFAIGHYHMGQSERFIKNAKSFKPERWIKTHKGYEKIHPFIYLPFGHGPRMCIGRRFAELETSILVAKILRNYTVDWEHPDLQMVTSTITKPAGPLKFTFKKRC